MSSGKYFTFYPVLSRRSPLTSVDFISSEVELEQDQSSDWTVFGSEEEIFVFACDRRIETMDWEMPPRSADGDRELMRAGDDQFEMLLMSALEL